MPEARNQKQRLITLWIIWWAMFVSLVMYGAIAHLIAAKGALPDANLEDGVYQTLVFALTGMSFVNAAIGLLIRRFMLLGSGAKLTLGLGNERALYGRYSVILIISLACADAVGIFGLVLFLLRGNFMVLYSFLIPAMVLMGFLQPSMKEFDAYKNTVAQALLARSEK